VLALAVAAAAIALFVLSRRAGEEDMAQPSSLPASPPTFVRPVIVPVASTSTVERADAPDSIVPVEVATTDGVAFAQAYADALCACTEPSCLDAVRERYARALGQAQASRDGQGLHDAFVRGQACVRAVRAAAGDASGAHG